MDGEQSDARCYLKERWLQMNIIDLGIFAEKKTELYRK